MQKRAIAKYRVKQDFFDSLKAAPAEKTVENESKRALATGGFDAESETEDEEEPPAKKAKK